MKILQVNCHYNYGSTGKIMYDINEYLVKNNIDSVQCYSRGKTVKEKNVYRIANEGLCKMGKALNYVLGNPFAWGEYSTKSLIRIIKEREPDVVHLHCINAYTLNIYSLLNYLKKSEQRTIITLHAEFMHTGGCAYAYECNQWCDEEGCVSCKDLLRNKATVKHTYENWKRMYLAFKGFNKDKLLLVSVSPWLEERAKRSTILKEYNHRTVLNGIDINAFRRSQRENEISVREKYRIGNGKYLLHVTSDFDAPVKGGKYVDYLSKLIVNDDLKIVVVGPNRNRNNTDHLQFVGVVTDKNELATLYACAEVTVLTSEKETFSMICAESLSCGTPVVGFEAGAPETIAIKEYSRFVKFGDVKKLYDEVHSMSILSDNKQMRDIIADTAYKRYSSEIMAKQYLELYKELINV